jgi:hypothetical protein
MRFFSTVVLGALAGEALARVPPSMANGEKREAVESRATKEPLIKQTKAVKSMSAPRARPIDLR